MKPITEKGTLNIPRHGYISELARICNCSRKTVTRALFEGQQGAKSDMVREHFQKHYASPDNI